MELVTRPSGIQRNSIQEVFPEHLIHSLPTYVLGVGCMPEADKAVGGGHSDEQGGPDSCPPGAYRRARRMEAEGSHKMRTDE